MLQKWFVLLLLVFSALNFQGCVYLIVGGVGALGGYVVSPDTVEGVSSNDMESLWDATIDVVSIMGVIEEQSKEGGMLIARVNGARVTVTLSSINQNNTKLTVKARKAFLPKISVAQDVFVKVMSNMNE